MREIRLSAGALAAVLLNLSEKETVCLLDSNNVSHLGSHFLLAGVKPLEIHEMTDENPHKTLRFLDEKLSQPDIFSVFTLSYDLGLKLERIRPRTKEFSAPAEPDIFLALFDCLIVHDYNLQKTFLTGSEKRFDELEKLLLRQKTSIDLPDFSKMPKTPVESNFSRPEYLGKINEIKELIRRGDTYQTNLTQQFRARLPKNLSPQQIFYHLRKNHPAPFAAFLKRKNSFVVSASPERFFKVQSAKPTDSGSTTGDRQFLIETSPIKGTRPRGKNAEEDARLREELLNSPKDRAENIMIVDLLRNDLGRVCDFGSVRVENLCELEEHPTFFHLVSTISGNLRAGTNFSDLISAVFPCGSITGAPKIRTMQIIDKLETAPRGLSMGAIGYSFQGSKFKIQIPENKTQITKNFEASGHQNSENPELDLSVAIRTMTIRDDEAVFNVGGGIVIDSSPENEYEETLTKAKALFDAINADFIPQEIG